MPEYKIITYNTVVIHQEVALFFYKIYCGKHKCVCWDLLLLHSRGSLTFWENVLSCRELDEKIDTTLVSVCYK